MSLRIAVPTSTIIATSHKKGPHMVLMMRNYAKYGPKLTFPGGRVAIGDETYEQTARREFKEEVGLPILSLQPFFLEDEPDRDVRRFLLGQFQECHASEDLHHTQADAYFCSDMVYVAEVDDTRLPQPLEDEADELVWIDVRSTSRFEFALGHDVYLRRYFKKFNIS